MTEADKAYMEKGRPDIDPYIDTLSTFKALIAVIAVTASITLLAFWVWGK
jgi:hypothetical protein